MRGKDTLPRAPMNGQEEKGTFGDTPSPQACLGVLGPCAGAISTGLVRMVQGSEPRAGHGSRGGGQR